MSQADKPSVRERLREELIKYALISLYLFVCFVVVLLYEASIRDASGGLPQLRLGFAVVQALVLGKFILIGNALSVGKRADQNPLLHRIAWKSLAMLVLLLVFKAIEEVIVGLLHGGSVASVAEEFMALSAIQMLAPTLLMLLILVPLTTASEIYRAVGGERFKALLFRANSP